VQRTGQVAADLGQRMPRSWNRALRCVELFS
jgi:hypothetical protein